jgi:hypothetical protein
MNDYTTENLEKGTGVAFYQFGGKAIITLAELEEVKSDDNVRKIYFNFDGSAIRRVK